MAIHEGRALERALTDARYTRADLTRAVKYRSWTSANELFESAKIGPRPWERIKPVLESWGIDPELVRPTGATVLSNSEIGTALFDLLKSGDRRKQLTALKRLVTASAYSKRTVLSRIEDLLRLAP